VEALAALGSEEKRVRAHDSNRLNKNSRYDTRSIRGGRDSMELNPKLIAQKKGNLYLHRARAAQVRGGKGKKDSVFMSIVFKRAKFPMIDANEHSLGRNKGKQIKKWRW